jgi:hypothetical protein
MMNRLTGMILMLALLVLPLVAQDAPVPSPDAVTPVEVSATSTPEATIAAEVTSTLEPSPLAERTAEATDAVQPTAEVTAVVETDIVPTDAPSVTSSPTVLTVLPDTTATTGWLRVQGSAEYQHRVTQDHSGILIEVFSAERYLLSSAYTDAVGQYEVIVPDQPYWLVASAAGHQQVAGVVQAGTLPLPIILPGGDLDADGCVTTVDLEMMHNHLDGIMLITDTDFNQDGETTVADLVILAGNIKPMCEVFVRTQAAPVTPPPTLITLVPALTDLPATELTPIDASPEVTVEPTMLPLPTSGLPETNTVPLPTLSGSTPDVTPASESTPEAGIIATEEQEE